MTVRWGLLSTAAIGQVVAGAVRGQENALRDPAIFSEDDRTYLLYSVAGESGIAIAEISE